MFELGIALAFGVGIGWYLSLLYRAWQDVRQVQKIARAYRERPAQHEVGYFASKGVKW